METTSHHPSDAAGAPETWACPECGARNRATAEWCGQCYWRPPRDEPAEASGAEAALRPSRASPASLEEALLQVAKNRSRSPATEPPAGEVSEAQEPPETPVQRGAFTVAGDGITWTCRQCDATNDLSQSSCGVCETPFAEMLKEPAPERPERDPGTAALISLFFPGAGHAYLGHWGQAIARGAVSSWVGLVVLFAAFQGGPGAVPTLVAFGIAAFCLWAVSAHDSYRAAAGEDSAALLKNKHFLFLVLGLLGLQIGLLFLGALTAR